MSQFPRLHGVPARIPRLISHMAPVVPGSVVAPYHSPLRWDLRLDASDGPWQTESTRSSMRTWPGGGYDAPTMSGSTYRLPSQNGTVTGPHALAAAPAKKASADGPSTSRCLSMPRLFRVRSWRAHARDRP